MADRNLLDRAIDVTEKVAGAFLALVTALTFVSVVLRYGFSWSIPDSFDVGRYLLGIIIFWGIAVASYRGDHIAVSLLWSAFGPRVRRAMDLFAAMLTMFCLIVFTWMVAYKVINTRQSNVLTMDLNLPVWPYYFVAWLGLALAVALMLVRIARQLTRNDAETAARPVSYD
jgi:TRAP-type transport system small permease protein